MAHATFGELLRYWRKARRVSQLDLSLEAGVFTAITSVGAPLDAALQELTLETFLPVDDRTDATLRAPVLGPSE